MRTLEHGIAKYLFDQLTLGHSNNRKSNLAWIPTDFRVNSCGHQCWVYMLHINILPIQKIICTFRN
jgi:hypothetical protein